MDVLNDGQLKDIDSAVMNILNDQGVLFASEKALKALDEIGADVDFDSRIVKISPEVVEKALNTAPETFSMWGRDLEEIKFGEGDIHMFAATSGLNFLESDSKTTRKPNSMDLFNAHRIVNNLDGISFGTGGRLAKDVPQDILGTWATYVSLRCGTKPINFSNASSPKDLKDSIKLANLVTRKVAANNGKTNKQFGLLSTCPNAPAKWTELSCTFTIEAAKSDLPNPVLPMPVGGMTAPATLAGMVVQNAMVVLSGVVLSQAIKPGSTVIYSGAPAYMDMRYSTIPIGCPEAVMVAAANAQMGKYYGLPTGTGMIVGETESKTYYDYQSGAESTMEMLTLALSGNLDYISGLGLLDTQGTMSLEKLILDYELWTMVKRIVGGMETSDDHLALDVAKDVGVTGDFMTKPHTMKWFKREYSFSEVFDRRSRDAWNNDPSDISKSAESKVNDLLESVKTKRLPRDIESELDEAAAAIFEARGYDINNYRSLLPDEFWSN